MLIGCYFIDRSPKHFGLIIDYLRTGKLDVEGLSSHEVEKLNEELDYFQIPNIKKESKSKRRYEDSDD